MEKEPIKIWRFEDAPKEYQKLSTNGGDEDWLALMPNKFNGGDIPIFLQEWQEGMAFGYCNVDEYKIKIKNKIYKVIIGSHA
jgi:hypothetical protein